ncbi:trypsin-like serine protease [Arthrobacter ulcerisalmonis]|uniref:trypsin-like serine protease n=1 Tax=Arthrobacter ulcerisalmonis TaxID=2483813 RepID=UPI00362CC25D
MKIARILGRTATTTAAAAMAVALLVPLPAHAAPASGGDTASPDIAGGATTTISAAPYAAQISFDATGTNVGCTGSQISESWVITAKHCNSTSLQSVRLGATYLQTGGTVKTVAARYASSTGDVLLLKLSSPYYGSYIGLSSSFPATGLPPRYTAGATRPRVPAPCHTTSRRPTSPWLARALTPTVAPR